MKQRPSHNPHTQNRQFLPDRPIHPCERNTTHAAHPTTYPPHPTTYTPHPTSTYPPHTCRRGIRFLLQLSPQHSTSPPSPRSTTPIYHTADFNVSIISIRARTLTKELFKKGPPPIGNSLLTCCWSNGQAIPRRVTRRGGGTSRFTETKPVCGSIRPGLQSNSSEQFGRELRPIRPEHQSNSSVRKGT